MDEMRENAVKHTVKDSLFADLFSFPEYVMDLYRTLHPEDKDSTEADIENVTLKTTFLNDMVNDLGFQVKDRLMILVESQSTLSVNILIRSFLYLAKSYENFFYKTKDDLYHPQKVHLPKPELYMIYVGEERVLPKTLQLSSLYFDGEPSDLDVKVHVLTNPDPKSILGQYLRFCEIYNRQRKIHGRILRTIEETIRICKAENILSAYLAEREIEVIKMYSIIFDDNFTKEAHEATIVREAKREGRNEGISIGEARGISIGRDAAEQEFAVERAALLSEIARLKGLSAVQ